MNDINQVKEYLQNELQKAINTTAPKFKRRTPSSMKIISSLFNLRIDKEGIEFAPKDEWRYVPQAEFFNIIGEIFNRNPEFYMKYLYRGIKKKMRKLNGIDKLQEMEKTIIEKYCLRPGEQILLKFDGVIEFWENPILKSRGVRASGTLFFTSHRIIVCPSFSIIGRGLKASSGIGISNGTSSRNRIINNSIQEKCYGYIFPINIISKLKKKSRGVTYNVVLNNKYKNINIKISKSSTQQEDANKLFEIISKEGANQR